MAGFHLTRVDGGEAIPDIVGAAHGEAAFFHGAFEPGQERLVVVHQQQARIGLQQGLDVGHGIHPQQPISC